MDSGETAVLPEADVHICIVRAGEPLYLPDTVNEALGLANGGSYAVVEINGLVVIAPQGPAINTACRLLHVADSCADGTMPGLLDHLDAVRSEVAGQVRERICPN